MTAPDVLVVSPDDVLIFVIPSGSQLAEARARIVERVPSLAGRILLVDKTIQMVVVKGGESS